MSWILDTCVISELIKREPEKKVARWFSLCDEERLYISSITLGEIIYGIDMVREGKKRNELLKWFCDLVDSFRETTLPVTDCICLRWGRERARCRKRGIQLPVIDGLIACTAMEHNCTLVTRNVSDFDAMNIQIFNPWE